MTRSEGFRIVLPRIKAETGTIALQAEMFLGCRGGSGFGDRDRAFLCKLWSSLMRTTARTRTGCWVPAPRLPGHPAVLLGFLVVPEILVFPSPQPVRFRVAGWKQFDVEVHVHQSRLPVWHWQSGRSNGPVSVTHGVVRVKLDGAGGIRNSPLGMGSGSDGVRVLSTAPLPRTFWLEFDCRGVVGERPRLATRRTCRRCLWLRTSRPLPIGSELLRRKR